jgi:hypothetical protein
VTNDYRSNFCLFMIDNPFSSPWSPHVNIHYYKPWVHFISPRSLDQWVHSKFSEIIWHTWTPFVVMKWHAQYSNFYTFMNGTVFLLLNGTLGFVDFILIFCCHTTPLVIKTFIAYFWFIDMWHKQMKPTTFVELLSLVVNLLQPPRLGKCTSTIILVIKV